MGYLIYLLQKRCCYFFGSKNEGNWLH